MEGDIWIKPDPWDEAAGPQTGWQIIKAASRIVEQEVEKAGAGMEGKLSEGDIACILHRLGHMIPDFRD